jgi:hypothetical protein
MSDGEVTIICLVDSIHIADLGLRLVRGARASVPMTAAMKSRDLSRAKVDGTVGTQTLRSSVIRAQEHVSSDTVTSQSPRAPTVDLTPLLGAIHQLTDEVRALRADMASFRPPTAQTLDLTPLVQQLQGALVRHSGSTPAPAAGAATVEPGAVFIPSNITGGDLTASLNVSSESSDDPGLADTMKALKAARKKR